MNQYEIDRIVQAVLEELQKRAQPQAKRALLLYTGAALGFDAALESICRLRQEGWQFDVFCTPGAQQALDMELLRAHAASGPLLTDCGDASPEAFAGQYETIIVPALTVNTAAKLSGCIMDTPATRMLLSALMKGRRVVLATDGCCPDCPGREALGYRMPEPMKARLRGNLETLRAFGAVLTSVAGLADTVAGTERKQQEPERRQSGGAPGGKRPLITRKQVDACPNGGVLTVPKNSNVTALAEDLARERGITIVKT